MHSKNKEAAQRPGFEPLAWFEPTYSFLTWCKNFKRRKSHRAASINKGAAQHSKVIYPPSHSRHPERERGEVKEVISRTALYPLGNLLTITTN